MSLSNVLLTFIIKILSVTMALIPLQANGLSVYMFLEKDMEYYKTIGTGIYICRGIHVFAVQV